jgi:hypothetical protein
MDETPAFVPLLYVSAADSVSEDHGSPQVRVSDRLDLAAAPSGPPLPNHPRRKGIGRLLRVGAPAVAPLASFPPWFDTRLWYRSAHQPYRIHDQEDCASCVFIAAATVAEVRAGIQRMEGDGPSAADMWRHVISGEKDGQAAAVRAFYRVMAERALQGARSRPAVPALDWRRFICCTTKCPPQGPAHECYHHQDGDPKRAPFSCADHVEGVVPHHFVEWVARVGFHAEGQSSPAPVIRTVEPERQKSSPRFALVEPLQVKEVDEQTAGAVAGQVRRIKTSLMAHGPVMAMMRIHGQTFDVWGSKDADKEAAMRAGYRLPGPDIFDEYHEVTIVGWGTDDYGKPCWLIVNSYGDGYNCHCAPDPDLAESAAELRTLADAYNAAGLTRLRGCVMVEMVNAELVRSRQNTDLENNIIAFVPRVDDAAVAVVQAGRPAERSGAQADAHAVEGSAIGYGLLFVVIVMAALMARFGRKANTG